MAVIKPATGQQMMLLCTTSGSLLMVNVRFCPPCLFVFCWSVLPLLFVLLDGASFASAPADVEKAAEYVGFPAVIKPIAAAASMGVVRVDNLPELKAKVAATQKQLAGLYLDEHVSNCAPSPAAPAGTAGVMEKL
jgi:carbamoylphosphate synthase large subunit